MLLINDIKTFKQTLGGVQRNMEWENWSPFIEQAEQAQIVPVIGEKFYEELCALEIPPSGVRGLLLKKLQRASAYYAKALSLFEMSTVVGDAGIMENAPMGSAPMGRWKFIGMLKSNTDNAEKSLESALAFLELYKDKDEFASWKNDIVYTVAHDSFIISATQLTEYFPAAKNSRRLFLELQQYIKDAEIDYIKPLISVKQYKSFKEKLRNSETIWDENEKEALRYLGKIVAYYAFHKAIPLMNLNADFHLVSDIDGLLKDELPNDSKRTEMKMICEDTYKDTTIKLRNFLDTNASETLFVEYFNSDLYVSKQKNKTSPLNRKPIDPAKPHILL